MFSKINIATISITFLAVYASSSAQAVTADLSVVGTITPSACRLDVDSGGKFDFGKISSDRLSADKGTSLGGQTKGFTITCNAATKLALHAIDNRVSSVALDAWNSAGMGIPTTTADKLFGLGTANDKKIGAYSLNISDTTVTVDSASAEARGLVSTDKTTWSKLSSGQFYGGTNYISWSSTAATTTPGSFTSIAGTLSVGAVVNKSSELDLSEAITLDGSATLEIIYL